MFLGVQELKKDFAAFKEDSARSINVQVGSWRKWGNGEGESDERDMKREERREKNE